MSLKKTICKVFLVSSLSSQLENDGGKLLGMARGVEAPTFPQFIQVGSEKMPFLRKNTSIPIRGVFVEYDFSRFIGGYSEWMFIPFDILVFALGACLKERLSNSFYKSSSLCCRRTYIQLLHIYILVPALGGAWKVE